MLSDEQIKEAKAQFWIDRAETPERKIEIREISIRQAQIFGTDIYIAKAQEQATAWEIVDYLDSISDNDSDDMMVKSLEQHLLSQGIKRCEL